LFPASGLTGGFNLLFGDFLLLFYAELLSALLVLRLVLPTAVLYDAMKTSRLRFNIQDSRIAIVPLVEKALGGIPPNDEVSP
jgi:hypothetical protein